ncbi:hypothetical protein LTR74_009707 [Friedmanniomyces endolithicus]|nr:hypothetical protein LTR74_009707 [Friedmanniomyces endolithicus]
MVTNTHHTHLPASATSPPPPTIMLSTVYADWQCWPHHDELFFDIFVTPAVTEFRDHRHKQWFKTCCLKSPRYLVCGLRRAESPGPTPQYARWDGPDRPTERKTYLKTGKRNVRQQAERDEFPWNRRVDIVEGKGVPASLGHQRLQFALAAVVRSQNAPAVLKIDKNLAEKQKTTRARKNGGTPTANHGVTASEESEGNEEDKTAQNKSKNENIGGDTYYPGSSAVLSTFRDVDRRKAMEFHFKIFDDLRLKAAERRSSLSKTSDNFLDAAE